MLRAPIRTPHRWGRLPNATQIATQLGVSQSYISKKLKRVKVVHEAIRQVADQRRHLQQCRQQRLWATHGAPPSPVPNAGHYPQPGDGLGYPRHL